MQNFLGTLVGKSIRLILSFRSNGGHALPGLIIDKLFPGYVGSMLSKLPEGVVIITGTNGKTTTTKIVSHILAANGKRVLTNQTGSNLVRGIASSLARSATLFGGLKYDIAVLEIDEATAKALVNQVKPRWVLGLNVSRDQLDRFGEVDVVAKYIGKAMEAATEGVVINAKDPQLIQVSESVNGHIQKTFFGFAEELRESFPNDYELASVTKSGKSPEKIVKTDVELVNFGGQKVVYIIDGTQYEAQLKLSGQHNFLNGAAALALCRKLVDASDSTLINQLSEVDLAFGRGEKYRLKNGSEIELVLVKNPASFTQALASYGSQNANFMVAINDNIADGRDVSWLWDVNFEPLHGHDITITSGTRAADMALRFHYDDIKVLAIEPVLSMALKHLSSQTGDKIILATYTAMLSLYNELNKAGTKIS